MHDDRFEDLAKRWPDLFRKSNDFELSIDNGWYDIIDILCGMLSADLERSKRLLKYCLENPTANPGRSIQELEAEVATAFDDLPTIVQVKEKFGTLRFYVNGGTPQMHNYIEFAEAMSGRTCEVCGSPGKSRNGNWIKVLCKKHCDESENHSYTMIP